MEEKYLSIASRPAARSYAYAQKIFRLCVLLIMLTTGLALFSFIFIFPTVATAFAPNADFGGY